MIYTKKPDGAPYREEIDALRRQGMRWAVLTSLRHDLNDRGVPLPSSLKEDLSMSKVMLESGCYSPCEIVCALDRIEAVLVSNSTTFGEEYFDGWLALLGKAMKDNLSPEEVTGVPFLQSIISDCEFLKCGCSSTESRNFFEN